MKINKQNTCVSKYYIYLWRVGYGDRHKTKTGIMKLTLINITWSRGRWNGFLYLPLNEDGSPILNMDKFEKLTGFYIPRGSTFTIN